MTLSLFHPHPGGHGPPLKEFFHKCFKIQALIQKGIDEGARLVCGGTGRPEGLDKGYYVKPTIFADVKNDMTIAKEEIFGPVLSILPYDSDEEVIHLNHNQHPISSSSSLVL